MDKKLNALALGYSAGILSALAMLAMWILDKFGLYAGAINMMEQWHLFFSPSIGGLIGGMIEAAIISFVFGYLFAYIYNKLA
ncbi:MAG: DUF5676 family membrane protein [bacterium]|nr:DUF5676 family membrane protein [bacterium]